MNNGPAMERSPRPFFESLEAFIGSAVLPLQASHPEWVSFDGERTGGNRTPIGYFIMDSGIWRVHADIWFRSLLIACRACQQDGLPALVVQETARGQSKCLVLRPDLRGWNRFKHLYVYWHGPCSRQTAR